MKQLKFTKLSLEKDTFIFIFLILVVILMFMPIFNTFNDILTRTVIRLDVYQYIQKYVIPWEIRMVAVLLWPLGLSPRIAGEYLSIGSQQPLLIEIAWNCIGWRSLLLFLMTAWVGLQGSKYTVGSKIKAWMIGFLGTFIINIARITLVVLLTYYFGHTTGIIFHDYGSTLSVIVWLFFFWWFSYSFVLEEKESNVMQAAIKV